MKSYGKRKMGKPRGHRTGARGTRRTMNDLLENINKIHTTDLGVMRIKRNLGINVINAVNWCKKKIKKADKIIKNGKNWYIYMYGTLL